MILSFLEYLLDNTKKCIFESNAVKVNFNAFVDKYNDDVYKQLDTYFPADKKPILSKLSKLVIDHISNFSKEQKTNKDIEYFKDFTLDLQNAKTLRIAKDTTITTKNRFDVINKLAAYLKDALVNLDTSYGWRISDVKAVKSYIIVYTDKVYKVSKNPIVLYLHIRPSNSANNLDGSQITEYMCAFAVHELAKNGTIQSLQQIDSIKAFISFLDEHKRKYADAKIISVDKIDELIKNIETTTVENYILSKIQEGQAIANNTVSTLKKQFGKTTNDIKNVQISNSNKKLTTEDVCFYHDGLKYGISVKAPGKNSSGHAFKEARMSTLIKNKILTSDEYTKLFKSISIENFIKWLKSNKIDISQYRMKNYSYEHYYELPAKIYFSFIQDIAQNMFNADNEDIAKKYMLYLLGSVDDSSDPNVIPASRIFIVNSNDEESTEDKKIKYAINTLANNNSKITSDGNQGAKDIIKVNIYATQSKNNIVCFLRFGNGKIHTVKFVKDTEGNWLFVGDKYNSIFINNMSVKFTSIKIK